MTLDLRWTWVNDHFHLCFTTFEHSKTLHKFKIQKSATPTLLKMLQRIMETVRYFVHSLVEVSLKRAIVGSSSMQGIRIHQTLANLWFSSSWPDHWVRRHAVRGRRRVTAATARSSFIVVCRGSLTGNEQHHIGRQTDRVTPAQYCLLHGHSIYSITITIIPAYTHPNCSGFEKTADAAAAGPERLSIRSIIQFVCTRLWHVPSSTFPSPGMNGKIVTGNKQDLCRRWFVETIFPAL